MLHGHLGTCKNNMGAFSDEQGKRFHPDVMDFERIVIMYHENTMNFHCIEKNMGNYIRGLIRNSE